MGLNSQSDIETDIQIGPTSSGMVRIYVSGGAVDLPMDFSPVAAREIAEELNAAAEIAETLEDGSAKGGSAEAGNKKRRKT